MKKFLIAIVSMVLLSQSVEAALPPLYQSKKEIDAIFASPEYGQVFQSGELITEIKRTENGFDISTNKNRVHVDIIYQSNPKPGPIQFKVKFGTPEKLNGMN
ncbi:MAG: hypothetical protein H0W88_04520 [Parachlamydiaceae bacterium]|nr:hypothetical protein [Parachlamydiaceae bacterium]